MVHGLHASIALALLLGDAPASFDDLATPPPPAREPRATAPPVRPSVPPASPPPIAAPTAAPIAVPVVAAVPWLPGEELELVIEYLGIKMGKSRISVGELADGQFPVRLDTTSAGLAAVVTLKQSMVSQIDAATLLPRTSVLEATEPGGYHHLDTATFDRAANTVSVRVQAKRDTTKVVEVPPGTLDFLAMVFQLRTLPLEDGLRHEFQVLAGRKVNKVVAEVVKHETLKTPAGKIPSVKVRVPTGFDGKFSEKNPTFLWLSDDPRRLVVRIATDFAIGRAEASLSRFTAGRAAPSP